MSHRLERGTVTAEFAVVVPAVLVVLGLILGVIAIQRDSLIAQSVAGQVARALGRGEPEDLVRQRLAEAGIDGRVVVTQPDVRHVCITVSTHAGPTALDVVTGEVRACAPIDVG